MLSAGEVSSAKFGCCSFCNYSGAAADGDLDSHIKSVKRRTLAFGDNTTGPAMCSEGTLAYWEDRLNAVLSKWPFECTMFALRVLMLDVNPSAVA